MAGVFTDGPQYLAESLGRLVSGLAGLVAMEGVFVLSLAKRGLHGESPRE